MRAPSLPPVGWTNGSGVKGFMCEGYVRFYTLIHKETSLHPRESTQLGAEVRAVWGGWLGLSKEQICGFTESCAARPALNAWCTRLCIPAASLGAFSFAGWTGGTGWSLLGKALLLNAVPGTCTSVVCDVPFPSSPAALLRASVGTRETVVWHSFASPGRSYKVRHKSITNISQIIIFFKWVSNKASIWQNGSSLFQTVAWLCQVFSSISTTVQLTIALILSLPVLRKMKDHSSWMCLEKKNLFIKDFFFCIVLKMRRWQTAWRSLVPQCRLCSGGCSPWHLKLITVLLSVLMGMS